MNYLAGDEKCFESLVRKYRPRIFGVILKVVKDQMIAEDVYQETLIKIHGKLHAESYREEGKFLPWALRIAKNLAIDHFRKSKRSVEVKTDMPDNLLENYWKTNGTMEQRMMEREQRKELRGLIDQLPRKQREVLLLRHYNDMSFKEIAEHTNVSINTALGRMRYAIMNLRKLAGEQNFTA